MIDQILERVGASVEDFRGIVLVGLDGLPVEKYRLDDAELESLMVEFMAQLKKLQHLMRERNLGSPVCMTINGDKVNYILHRVNQNYFLFLVLGPDAGIGRSKYELLKAAMDLQEELAQ
jgi:predicted regulator of Ras-like GTPase activity (Roadblock/LC7/MglB family)